MPKVKRYRYIVRVSPRSTIVVLARTASEAKQKVWNQIKDGYTYGFDSRGDFFRRTTAKRATQVRRGVYRI